MQHPNDVIRFSDAATNICRSYLTRRLRKSRGLMHSCQPNLRDNRMTSLGSLRRRQAQGPTTSLSHNPNIPPAAFPVSKSVKEREEGGRRKGGVAEWQSRHHSAVAGGDIDCTNTTLLLRSRPPSSGRCIWETGKEGRGPHPSPPSRTCRAVH